LSNLSCKVYPDCANVDEKYISDFNKSNQHYTSQLNPRTSEPYVNALLSRDKNSLKRKIYEEVINVLLMLNIEESKQIKLLNKSQPKTLHGIST